MEPENVIVFSRRSFWIIKGTIAVLVLIIFSGAMYFHGEHVRRVSYLENRKDFIEQHKEVQWVLSSTTFCYKAEGGFIQPAKYKGRGVFKIDDSKREN